MIRWLGRACSRPVKALGALMVLTALLIGLPWALVRYVGWPLPDRVPSVHEFPEMLLATMSPTLLLDVLACLCWLAWVGFVVDVARSAARTVRGTRLPTPTSPGNRVAAVLVGALLMGLLGDREAREPSTPLHIDTASPAISLLSADNDTRVTQVRTTGHAATASEQANTAPRPETVVVRAPVDGVHDSLWHIAQRALGDGARWPEIYALNEGRSQPDGRVLDNPNRIFPGEELRLPGDDDLPAFDPSKNSNPPQSPQNPSEPNEPSSVPTAPAPPERTTSPSASPSPGQSSSSSKSSEDPTHAIDADHRDGRAVVFVGLGLAAAVSAALLLARRRHQRAYRPGSRQRDVLPVAPVVYQLHLAHLRSDDTERPALADDLLLDEPRSAAVGPAHPHPAGEDTGDAAVSELGVRDGREIAVDLARIRGLGVVGEGASAAVRALLLTLLTRSDADHPPSDVEHQQGSVVTHDQGLTQLLGANTTSSGPLPSRLTVAADLDAALDDIDAKILRRLRTDDPPDSWPVLAIVAQPPDHAIARLQAVLDNGSRFGVIGIILGPWRPGATAHVRADGVISATSPGISRQLRGTHMFRLPDTAAVDLLHLLHHADSAAPPATVTPTSIEPDIDEAAEHLDRATAQTPPSTTADQILEVTAASPIDPEVSADHEFVPIREQDPVDTYVPLELSILGSLRLHFQPDPDGPSKRREIAMELSPRQRELVVFLAVHPNGVSREVIVRTLWAASATTRPTNALNTALTRLRKTITEATDGEISDFVVVRGDRYHLDPDRITVDFWTFSGAVAARRAAITDTDRLAADHRAVDAYGGQLADNLDVDWIEALREATRRDALDAVSSLARATVAADPSRTLALLETARAFDPHNELLYRDIMRLQSRLDRPEAIGRTLSLLTTRLVEIDESPTLETGELAHRLEHRHDAPQP